MDENIACIRDALATIDIVRKRDGSFHLNQPAKSKSVLEIIDTKLVEIEEYYWRPIDSKGIYEKLKQIAIGIKDQKRVKKYDDKLKLIEANELEFAGRVQSFYGNNTEALKYYEEALALVPNHNLARAGREKALKSVERATYNLPQIERKLKIDPSSMKHWYNKGTALLNLGRVNEAINCFDHVLKNDPSYVDAWVRKGTALESLGKYRNAKKYFAEALKLNPNSMLAKRGLNYAEYFLGLSAKARKGRSVW
jgi:tetratricopeptide (TPR) repeat protein